MSDDKQHPADYALKRAQDWAVSAEEGGSYEATNAAALTSLAWSAVSFLSRDSAPKKPELHPFQGQLGSATGCFQCGWNEENYIHAFKPRKAKP